MTNLLSRIAVAVVGLPIVLAVVWAGGWWLFGLAVVVAFVSLHEYARLVRELRPLVLASYLGVAALLVAVVLGGLPWLVGAFLTTLLVAFALQTIGSTRQPATIAIGATVLGAAWIGLGVAHVVLLRDVDEHGRLAVLTVLLAVFAADTAAFFVGRLIGRHKLAPTISPGKTWEGFVAGTLAAVAVTFFALYADRESFLSISQSLALGGVIAVAGVIGDLFESALKRDMRVKDTGRLLGGHGGMLDRIDAHLFAVPAAYYLIRAFGYS